MPSVPEILALPPLPNEFLSALSSLFQPDDLGLDAASLRVYGYDNSRRSVPAQAVVFVRSGDQLLQLVALCRRHHVPIVARGRGTNTTGATVPVQGGVVVSFERMDRILEINPDDRLAVVQPGVLNGALQAALRPLGLMWAPDPTSAPFSTVGGNLACNAGGPHAVKYGACRDNVLALQVVDGQGRRLRLGTRTTKGSTGYDLMRVLIGSEGTLGLITEATLKLVPLPNEVALLRALYADVESAASAVARLMRAPVVPYALEFMDAQAIHLAREIGGAELDDAGALLMIEVDSAGGSLDRAVRILSEAASGPGLLALVDARTQDQIESLWRARRALSPALRTIAPKKINEDVVVPVSRLPELVRQAESWSVEAGFPIVCFGHAGNGNLHVNLLINPDDPDEAARASAVLVKLFQRVIELGGTLSGEHGIGLEKRDFLPMAIDPDTLAMMYELKDWLDPDGILNPGKVLPPRL